MQVNKRRRLRRRMEIISSDDDESVTISEDETVQQHETVLDATESGGYEGNGDESVTTNEDETNQHGYESNDDDDEEALVANRAHIVQQIAAAARLEFRAGAGDSHLIVALDDEDPSVPSSLQCLQASGWRELHRLIALWGREPAEDAIGLARMKALIRAKLPATNPYGFVTAIYDLDRPIALVDLHTNAYPLSALNMLAHLLCGAKNDTNNPMTIYLTCVIGPGFARNQLMQRHLDKRGDSSIFKDHVELFRQWAALDNGANGTQMCLKKFSNMIRRQVQKCGWRLTSLPRKPEVIDRSLFDEHMEAFTYRTLISDSSTLIGCFHFVARRTTQEVSIDAPVAELVFDDMVTWKRYPDLLYSDLALTESIYAHVRSNLALISSHYYRTVLEEYEDPPLVVISKFISCLMPEGHPNYKKEFFNIVVSGTERLGKTPSLILPVLIANSREMREIYNEAGQVLRTAIITGPNTLGPEQDLIAKFQRDIPKDLFNLHRPGGRGNAPHEMRRDSSHDGYVFGDSDSRAEVLRSMLIESTKGPDAQGKRIMWLLCIDEADHIFGRGWKPGKKPGVQNFSVEGSWSKAEGITRTNIRHPNIVCINTVTATELSLYETGPARVLSSRYKIHTVKLITKDTYYGVQRLKVKYPLADKEDIDVGDGRTTTYNGIHRCLSEFNDSVTCTFEDKTIHPMMLICVTLKVDVPRGQKEIAKALSLGEYQKHTYVANEDRWQERNEYFLPPMCVVYAGRIPTIYDMGIECEASAFLLEEYEHDTEVFPTYMTPKERASCARAKGDHLQTFLPLLMRRKGFHRKLILIGYSRLVRALTMSFTAQGDDGRDHLFYVTHAAFRVFTKPVKGEEYAMTCYSRCIEDIRQLLARSYSRTYGIDLDRAFGRRFEISVCTALTVPDDIRANMRLSATMTHLVGIHHDLHKAIKAIPVLPAELFGRSQHVMSTKRQTNVLQVRTRTSTRLQRIKLLQPTVYSTFVDTYDSLPSDARIEFADEANLDKGISSAVEQVQREMNEAYVTSHVTVRIFAPGDFFGRVFRPITVHDPETLSRYDFITHIGTPSAIRIQQQKQLSPNSVIDPTELAVDLMTRLLAFHFDWQPTSVHSNEMAISLPMRRQGCILSVAIFGLSARQKSYGMTSREVQALCRFATYSHADESIRVLSSDTQLFNSMRERFFLNDTLDTSSIAGLLSVYTTQSTVVKWLQECEQYTRDFMHFYRERATRLLDLNNTRLHPTVDVLMLIQRSTLNSSYPLQGEQWNDWLWDEFAKHVTDPGKQAEMEAWSLLLAPWKMHCSPTSVNRPSNDVMRLGILAGVIGVEYAEFGIPAETLDELLVALFGNLLSITDLLTCRNTVAIEASISVFSTDKPLTNNIPLLVETSSLFQLHPVLGRFFDGNDCPVDDSNIDCIIQLQEHVLGLYKQCANILRETYRISLKRASRPTPKVRIPPLSYRLGIEHDLALAATLPQEQWDKMPLSVGKNARNGRKFWKFFCHLFINNGLVVSTRNATPELIADFLQWTKDETVQGMPHHLIRYYFGAAPSPKKSVVTKGPRKGLTNRVKKVRRVWRETATGGGAHIVEISSGGPPGNLSVVYRIAWH